MSEQFIINQFIRMRGTWVPILVFILRGGIGDLQEFFFVIAGVQLLLGVTPLLISPKWAAMFVGWDYPTTAWLSWTVGLVGSYLLLGLYVSSGDNTHLRLGVLYFLIAQINLRIAYPLFDEELMRKDDQKARRKYDRQHRY